MQQQEKILIVTRTCPESPHTELTLLKYKQVNSCPPILAMALLDTTQAMYGGVTSQYLIQNGYARNSSYYREYEQDALARLNLQQRLGSSPEQHYDLHARLLVKEERLGGLGGPSESYSSGTAFKPYASPGQENVPHNHNQPAKVRWSSNCLGTQSPLTDDDDARL